MTKRLRRQIQATARSKAMAQWRGQEPYRQSERSWAMLELLLCSMLTILPDYLYRRFVQGKRLGKEITFYSVWFELRWGITSCLILTVGLITVIFYNLLSTSDVPRVLRTIPIRPDTKGRVGEMFRC